MKSVHLIKIVVAFLTFLPLSPSQAGKAATTHPADAGQKKSPPNLSVKPRSLHRPHRIVSLNVCTDQLLMMLVPPERIAALSHLARNPAYSAMSRQARKFPFTWGHTEEIFLKKPDLVISNPYGGRHAMTLLKKFGRKTLTLPLAGRFEDIVKNIKTLGNAVGEEQRAAQLVRAFEQELARFPLSRPQKPSAQEAKSRRTLPLAALYYANQYSAGKNTLINLVAQRAGFATLGEKLNYSGMRKLPLEELLVQRPDVLVLGKSHEAPALANEFRSHPALRKLAAHTRTTRLPGALTTCGTPHILKALRQLHTVKMQWEASQKQSQ